MTDTLIVQFVGYEVLPLVREYRFTVRESKIEDREFTLTIANASFDCRRARFQDAPHMFPQASPGTCRGCQSSGE